MFNKISEKQSDFPANFLSYRLVALISFGSKRVSFVVLIILEICDVTFLLNNQTETRGRAETSKKFSRRCFSRLYGNCLLLLSLFSSFERRKEDGGLVMA